MHHAPAFRSPASRSPASHASTCQGSVPTLHRAASPPKRPVVFVVRGRPGPLDRPPLPPDHADSWGLITDGTILHRAAYTIPAQIRPSPRG